MGFRVRLGGGKGLGRLGWAIATTTLVLLLSVQVSRATSVSNYELTGAKPFNQLETFPLTPLPTATTLRPNGNWIGRLILPSEPDYAADPGADWVWMEVWHAEGFPAVVGQTVKLAWKPQGPLEPYRAALTRDIRFSDRAERALEQGSIVPARLNGRSQVGPLQSLAGARPRDDVTVRLAEAEVVWEGDRWVVLTGLEPIQITGREYGLVKILEPDPAVQAPLPEQCPGTPPCPTEFFRVRFYNPAAQNFTGPIGTVRIPQQPMVSGERFFSNLRGLENSPAGVAGWYIYGARDGDGVFTVQALKPRALFQLQPDEVVLGQTPGLHYLDRLNWQHTPQRKGTLQRVLVSPTSTDPKLARNRWQEGDFALVIHLFGGIGGENGELTPAGTVPGHFAYGLARVVREPMTNELQLDIQYQQVYAHNPNGILSGTHDWTDYTGDLQRGWLGLRPFSDVVVKLDSFIQPFQFGETRLSLFRELLVQTQVMAARYRTGDGTGIAAVSPATSCVQDSNQALFIALQQIRRQIESQPEIVQWLQQNPESLETRRARQFVALERDLQAKLAPYGVIRPDWQGNADKLAGIAAEGWSFDNSRRLLSGALTWHSMMPRWSHDQVARIFLLHGADLWFLRTNMVGGEDPRLEPIAPTGLFGQVPLLGRAAQRWADAFATGLSGPMVALGLAALGLYALVALPYGLGTGFLVHQGAIAPPLSILLGLLRLFFMPALVQELLFRVLLLPHPVEGIPGGRWLLWAILSEGLFLGYHWLLGQRGSTKAKGTFSDRRFLILVGWLGLVLIGTYWITGSLWLVTLMHWLVVGVWLYGLGGYARLREATQAPKLPQPPLTKTL